MVPPDFNHDDDGGIVTPEVHVAADPPAAAALAARAVVALVGATVMVQGHASVVLSGGSTPVLLYRRLIELGADAAPWDRVTFLFGDERCVPTHSADSNSGTAWRELLLPLGVRRTNVIDVPLGEPVEAAARYAARIHDRFGPATPRLDLVLLGIGEDGHVASLFPGDASVDEQEALVSAVSAPPGHSVRQRITLTMPVINNARAVFVLATGAAKREAVSNAITGTGLRTPASQICPRGRLAWFLDAAAAPPP